MGEADSTVAVDFMEVAEEGFTGAFFLDGKWKVNLLCNWVMKTQASSTHAIHG